MRLMSSVWLQTTSLILASVTLILPGVYLWWRYRGIEGVLALLLICASAEWLLMSALELGTVDFATKLLWNKTKYIGIVVVPPLWVVFACFYSNHREWITLPTLALVSTVPVSALLLTFTNESHHLIWKTTTLTPQGPFLAFQHVYGLWFEIISVYLYILMFTGSLLLVQMFSRHRSLFFWQSFMLLVGGLTPSLWGVLYLLRFNPFPFLEPTPFSFPLANFVALFLLLEAKTRGIVPVARETVVESITDSIIVLDSQNRIIDMNAAAHALMGTPGLNRSIQDVLPHWGETAAQEREFTLRDRMYDMRVSVLRGWRGDVVSQVVVIRDITEWKKAEEKIKQQLKEKEVLLQEIHHRTKNNLQIISSLLSLQSRYMEGKGAEMLKESQNRIRTMALIHEKLYRSEDLADVNIREYIQDLVYGLVRSYSMTDINLVMEVGDVPLGIDAAIPCGLITNELVSNSLKHAFPQKKGEIRVSLRAADDSVELVVSDNGIGIPDTVDFRNTESLGLRLVTILAEDQLHGSITLNREKKTEFSITFRREGG